MILGSLKLMLLMFGMKYPQLDDNKRISTTPDSMILVEKIPAAVTAAANTKPKAEKDKTDARGEDLPRHAHNSLSSCRDVEDGESLFRSVAWTCRCKGWIACSVARNWCKPYRIRCQRCVPTTWTKIARTAARIVPVDVGTVMVAPSTWPRDQLIQRPV
jgi:hypothetical protein